MQAGGYWETTLAKIMLHYNYSCAPSDPKQTNEIKCAPDRKTTVISENQRKLVCNLSE